MKAPDRHTHARGWRGLLWLIAGCVAFILLAAATLPLWYPWALQAGAGALGGSIDAYERQGYAGVVLQGVRLERPEFFFRADRVRLPTPFALLAEHPADLDEAPISVRDWRLQLRDREPRAEQEPAVPRQTFETAAGVAEILRQWAPPALAEQGVVAWDERELSIPRLSWQNNQASAADLALDGTELGSARLDWPAEGPPVLSWQSERHQASASLRATASPERLHAEGELSWQGAQARLSASWSGIGWLPEHAVLASESFSFPASAVQLEQYAEITGSLLIRWSDGSFQAEVAAAARPSPGQEAAAPLRVDLQAEGDRELVSIQELDIEAPWIRAELAEAVQLDYSGTLLQPQARFSALLLLDRQPWFPLQGVLRGAVQAERRSEGLPRVIFALEGSNLSGFGFQAQETQIRGSWEHPRLTLERAEFQFTEESSAQVTARLDLAEQRVLSLQSNAELHPDFLARFLPEDVSFERIALEAQAEGPWSELAHRGEISVAGLETPELQPARLLGSWQGTAAEVNSFQLSAAMGAFDFRTEGSLVRSAEAWNLRLASGSVNEAGNAILRLTGPARIQWETSGEAGDSEIQLAVENFTWADADSGRRLSLQADVNWPEAGRWSLEASGLSTELARSALEPTLPEIVLHSAQTTGSWDAEGVTGSLQFNLESEMDQVEGLSASAELAIRPDQIEIGSFVVRGRGGSPVARAVGSIPLALRVGATGVRLEPRWAGDLDLRVETEPNAAFWERVAAWTGWRVREPQLRIAAAGSLRNPTGSIRLQTPQVSYADAPLGGLLALEFSEIEVAADLTPSRIELENVSFKVEGEPVRLTGWFPWNPRNWWEEWQQGEWAAWRRGELRVVTGRAELANFSKYLPSVITPSGSVELDLRVSDRGGMAGSLEFSGGATRPLGPLGPIRNVRGRMVFEGQEARLEELSGSLGGQEVILDGSVNLSDLRKPTFTLNLRGSNIPLVQQPGLIVRTDADLRVQRGRDGLGQISGNLTLRNSLLVADLASLLPGSVESPSRRPPYFSVSAEPFADWTLAVSLQGDRFLRIETPLFDGTFSADFRLEGTLEEPMALGRATAESGRIKFPFANLDLEQGEVRLTRENPYSPELFIVGNSRIFDYQIRMEARGPARQPRVTFTSNPPLSSEAILLLVTTGEVPESEFSLTTEQRASRLAFFLGRNLLAEFGPDGAGIDRLTIRTGEHLSRAGQETFYLEYNLGEDWSLIGEYDRFDQYNAGIKWRIYSK